MRALIRVAAIGLVVLGMARPARAVEEADHAAGRAAIGQQIDAFRRDDGPSAFALASPSIRGMFGSEEAFLEMVRRSYRPVYRPRRFDFGEARDTADGFEQSVAVQDEGGVDWDAIYSFERQPDGSWRISGCRLVKRPGDSV